MAFTESSQPPQANSLVSFLDTASKTIDGLMDKSSKGNKNRTKYLQKRLQLNPRRQGRQRANQLEESLQMGMPEWQIDTGFEMMKLIDDASPILISQDISHFHQITDYG